ncbi:acyl carrier protein phosphodiesterase [Marinobacterium nitratireducens]|nr:ACP phosphodiesterase [Marinobacterium nitratireducens]
MNYLAHFHLADRVDSDLTGNYLGDFVRGRDLDDWPAAVESGIRLHRRIDAFTDRHPAVQQAVRLLSPDRRRVAGIVVDVAFDHFLSRHWQRFDDRLLPEFTRQVYCSLAARASLMPESARRRFEGMRRDDWLVSYRELAVISQVLDAIAARMSRRTALYGAGEEVIRHYAELEGCFLDFYPQLLEWVRQDAVGREA